MQLCGEIQRKKKKERQERRKENPPCSTLTFTLALPHLSLCSISTLLPRSVPPLSLSLHHALSISFRPREAIFSGRLTAPVKV